jgi:hypothetical protein
MLADEPPPALPHSDCLLGNRHPGLLRPPQRPFQASAAVHQDVKLRLRHRPCVVTNTQLRVNRTRRRLQATPDVVAHASQCPNWLATMNPTEVDIMQSGPRRITELSLPW